MYIVESLMAATIIILGAGAIGMNLARPRRCPECGGRDTHEDADAHFWLGRKTWVCNDCERGFCEGDL